MADQKKNKSDMEQDRNSRDEHARRSRRRTRQFLGLALAVLIVVGAVSIVNYGINVVRTAMNDTSMADEYKARIAPFVWFDVLPFEKLEDANQDTLKQAVLWGVLNQTGTDKITRNERGEALVPAIEIDRYAAALFGPDFEFKHASFSDPVEGLEYTYDEEAGMYVVPATGIMPYYDATVVDITRAGGGVRKVVVGYVQTYNANDEVIATPDYEHPAKYMDYLFRRDGNDYYLYAIQPNTDYAAAVSSSSVSIPSSSLPPVSSSMADASQAESGSNASEEQTSGQTSE